MNPRFAQSAQISKQEALDARTRESKGTGGPFLSVPGLVALSAIAVMSTIGRVPLDLSETRLVMENHDERQPRTTQVEPMFDLQNAGTPQAVLARSVLSNDGNFQNDAAFYVTGDWHDEPETTEKSANSDEPVKVSEPAKTENSQPAQKQAKPASKKPVPAAPSGLPATDETTIKVDTEKTEDKDEDGLPFDGLPEALAEKLKAFPSLEAALNATNEEYNAVGIKGLDISNTRAALKKIVNSAS